jgi:two-component system cell cycle response regulator DivK
MIVIVDDDRDTRELYRACFDMSGFHTAEAGTGEEGLAVTRRLLPDVLLTDFLLPDLDGLTMATRLKEDARTSGVRVIVLTGYSGENFERRASSAGVERALLKPCLPQAMLREVRRALRRPATATH